MSKSTEPQHHRKLIFRHESIATLTSPALRGFEPGAATLHGCTRTNDEVGCKTK